MTADNALRNLRVYEIPQSIIISGVTGSGKTENTKVLLKFLSGAASTPLTGIIADANILLEAFGNASTEQNSNSSRFIKLIQVRLKMLVILLFLLMALYEVMNILLNISD